MGKEQGSFLQDNPEEIKGLQEGVRSVRELSTELEQSLTAKGGQIDPSIASYCVHLMRNLPFDITSSLRESAALPSRAGQKEETLRVADELDTFAQTYSGMTENSKEVVKKFQKLLADYIRLAGVYA